MPGRVLTEIGYGRGMERLAIVSGGGTGIGAATARVLVTAGCDVLIVGRRLDVLERAAREAGEAAGRPGAVRAYRADLADPAEVRRLADTVDRPVDVLVNNAGGFDVTVGGDRLDAIADWWRRAYETNVLTAVLLTEAIRPRLARPGGRVILLSSIAAQRGGGGPYSAAKAALHGYGYDLARELAPDGITVNVVAPGYTADTEFFGDRITPESHARRIAEIPAGRAGSPDDVAAAIAYLAAPSSGFVTGQILGVNGGAVLGR